MHQLQTQWHVHACVNGWALTVRMEPAASKTWGLEMRCVAPRYCKEVNVRMEEFGLVRTVETLTFSMTWAVVAMVATLVKMESKLKVHPERTWPPNVVMEDWNRLILQMQGID